MMSRLGYMKWLSNSAADKRRQIWCLKHKAMMVPYEKLLSRRNPRLRAKVWGVDWITKNKANRMGLADWGTRTKRQAIDKAMGIEARELKHYA